MKVLLICAVIFVGVSCYPQQRTVNRCRRCPMYIVEFCGSDGITYTSNPCFIKASHCSAGIAGWENFKMEHVGKCPTTVTKETTTTQSP